MHSRKIELDGDTETLDFGHAGVLYKNSFVMYDKRTNSKWNHSTGLAMAGALSGKELRTIPSRMVRWSTWRAQHPNTAVLLTEAETAVRGSYIGGEDSSGIGLSVGVGPEPTFYAFNQLLDRGVINDVVRGRAVVIVVNPESREAFAYSRRVADRELTFRAIDRTQGGDPLMTDRENGTVWNRMTGQAIDGVLEGEQLRTVVAVTWMRRRWRRIYENGNQFRRNEL